MSGRFSTFRSSFTQTVATESRKCSGCEVRIQRGEQILARDFIRKGKVEGVTMLHDNDNCHQEWEMKVLEAIANKRGSTLRR